MLIILTLYLIINIYQRERDRIRNEIKITSKMAHKYENKLQDEVRRI